MKAVLIFPPAADPAHPPLGISSLAGYLREMGQDVLLADLNVRSYNELLSSENLAQCARDMEARLGRFEAQEALAPADLPEYQKIAENLFSAGYLIDSVDAARGALRDPATYASRGAYNEVTTILRRAMQFVSAAYYPSVWRPGGFSMRYQPTRSADVLAACADRRQNLFARFLEGSVADIAREQPRVVGISISHYGQMIPAMTLASTVKRQLPEAFVVVGGGLVCFFDGNWEVLAPFRQLVDAWVPFEGERPLHDLMQALLLGRPLESVDGLLRFDAGRPLYRPPGPPPALSELPDPSFDGLPLDQYLAPEPILPVLASRGCYWGRCAFCSHDHLYRGRFRSRPAADVVRTVENLSRKHSTRLFYFVDEAIPPRLASEIAGLVATSSLPIRWFGEVRLESYFDRAELEGLRSGGCRMLMVGLESASDRVLAAMDKGISRSSAERILKDAAGSGIRTFVMFFTGFPTETHEEAEETVRFIERLRDSITHVAFTSFVLEQHSPAFRRPVQYGIADVFPCPDEDLKTWCDYEVREGLTETEAKEFAGGLARHPGIHPLDCWLMSRSHLVFLPHKDRGEPTEEKPPEADLGRPECLIPQRRPGLAPRLLAFSLDQIEQRLKQPNAPAQPLASNPTQYVMCTEREMLIEVGRDGLPLLRACNGRFTLADILVAVAEEDRDTTLRFLKDLGLRGFIHWAARA